MIYPYSNKYIKNTFKDYPLDLTSDNLSTIDHNYHTKIINKDYSPAIILNSNSAKTKTKSKDFNQAHNKRENESITIAQSINKILKGDNNIFAKNGGINGGFLEDLRNGKEKNSVCINYKCYDTKNFEKFEKDLMEKINQIKK